MQYATGRYMCYIALRHFFSVDDVATVLKRVYENRVTFHDGDAQVAPGIEVYKIGGHTAGLQIVRVMTQRGWIVLASDAMHYYRNYHDKRSEEHTSELQSLMRISYAVFCLKKKIKIPIHIV